jgi:hypothetical protein
MEICTCNCAIIRQAEGGKVCDRCGHWYDTRHGSKVPNIEYAHIEPALSWGQQLPTRWFKMPNGVILPIPLAP